jgi:N-methylhydantoinase B
LAVDGRSPLDPVTFSVIKSRLDSIAEEMTDAVERSAFTSMLSLLRDYSCCIYDKDSRQVATVDALPIQTNSMHLVVQAIRDSFGDDINDGDVIMCNDAYRGNNHSADLVTACPVFIDGSNMFWSMVRGHQLDMGAPNPQASDGAATSVWQEGLTIPPIKLYDRGRQRTDVLDLYLTNVRFSQLLHGDLMAMLGSIWLGARRLREVCARYGRATIQEFIDEVIDYARRRTEVEIERMPNGRFCACGWLDTDGSKATDVKVACTVTVRDHSVDVDFSGSDPAGAHGLNSSFGTTQAAGSVPIMMAIDPDIPRNDGCLRTITVSAPEGTICNPRWPTSTAEATTHAGDLMQEVVSMALAQAVPEHARSGSSRWANTPMLSGVDECTGVAWGHIVHNGGGGGPAAAGADGWPLIIGMAAFGALKFASIEQTELNYPIRFRECELESDSMGLGEYIGGPGIRCAFSPVVGTVKAIYTSDGLVNPPFGVGGATAGAGGGSYIEPSGDGSRRFLHCPLAPAEIKPGETWVGVSSGGGGWGDPLRRPPEQVRRDILDGIYSEDAARAVYGVVLDEFGEIDMEKTERLRAELSQKRHFDPSAVVPDAPRGSDWYKRNMRGGDVFITPMGWEGEPPDPTTGNQWGAPKAVKHS